MNPLQKVRLGIAGFFLLAFWACKDAPASSPNTPEEIGDTAPAQVQSRYPEAFARALEAHGGLENYEKFRSLEFKLENWPFGKKAPLTDLHRVDLQNRKVLIEGDKYRLGFDGDEVWVENPKALGTPADFYYATPYYFSLVPFVFTDPGTILEDQGPVTFQNTLYQAVKVTYESGIGDTPEDYYVLYLDPESYEVKMMSYIVSFPAFRNGKQVQELEPHVIVYRDYQEVEGLKMPHSFAFYNWNEGMIDLGEKPRGEAQFSQLKLTTEVFPDMIFNKTN